MSEIEEKQEKKLDRISERIYSASFILTVVLIIGAAVLTAVARLYSGKPDIELIPDSVFAFIKDALWVFVLPITVKIVGDRLPLLLQIMQAARGMQVTQTAEPISAQPAVNPVNQMNQMEGISNVNNG